MSVTPNQSIEHCQEQIVECEQQLSWYSGGNMKVSLDSKDITNDMIQEIQWEIQYLKEQIEHSEQTL